MGRDLTIIFENKPNQWGLRGDPYLWAEMAELCIGESLDTDDYGIAGFVSEYFEKVTGVPLTYDAIGHNKRFEHGGMSSGSVSGQFWISKGIPLLIESLHRVKVGYRVITLCGSTRFKDAFMEVQKRLTLEGNIVISVGLFGHSGDSEVWDGMDEGTLSKTKEMLDDMHKRKIDMADEIFVINVGGYIGESTRSEIDYALMNGKKVRYLEKRNGEENQMSTIDDYKDRMTCPIDITVTGRINRSPIQQSDETLNTESSQNDESSGKSRFKIINASCADQNVDVVVNAANDGLWAGGGISGVIFGKAGLNELTDACRQYKTPLKDGSAVITPAFNMTNAKAIIHAVGPNFSVTPKAFKELFEAYYNSLVVMKDNGYHSISFPLISSSIFGGDLPNPVAESTKQCVRAYKKFVSDYPDYDIDVKLCAFTASEMQKATQEYENIK